jgi:subtilisin family serine protease
MVSVKVLGRTGSGTLSGVLAGIEWIMERAIPLRDVLNLSLSTEASVVLDDVVSS